MSLQCREEEEQQKDLDRDFIDDSEVASEQNGLEEEEEEVIFDDEEYSWDSCVWNNRESGICNKVEVIDLIDSSELQNAVIVISDYEEHISNTHKKVEVIDLEAEPVSLNRLRENDTVAISSGTFYYHFSFSSSSPNGSRHCHSGADVPRGVE